MAFFVHFRPKIIQVISKVIDYLATALNKPPVAAADSYSIAEDGTLTVSKAQGVLANDTDPNCWDKLSVTLVDSTDHGMLALASDGSFVYIPNADFNGLDKFTYKAFDGRAYSAAVDATISVRAVNDGPVAAGDVGFTTVTDTPLTIDPATLTANDTDVDGDALAITAIGDVVGGTVEIVDGQILFTAADGFTGAASFSYVVDDGFGGTASASVTIEVTAPPCIVGTEGADTLVGGADDDCLKGLGGDDELLALNGNDTLDGGDGDDKLFGGLGQDILRGGEGDDRLTGGGDDDQLFGDGGNDVLAGSANDDILIGGAGADTMLGNAGADLFRFDAAGDLSVGDGGRDTIVNFEQGVDKIDLRPLGITAANMTFSTINAGTTARVGFDFDLDGTIDGELQVNETVLAMSDFLI